MKFSKFAETHLGTRAERTIELPRSSGEFFRFAVRPLNGVEEGLALERAREYAKKKGVADPKVGDALFDLGLMVSTIAIGAVDLDSPEDAREPAFDLGAEQILEALGREEITFVYERHQHWQDECSPYTSRMTSDEMLAKAIQIAEATDDLPFVELRPALRLTLLRSMASLLLLSPEGRSLFGSPTDTTTPRPLSIGGRQRLRKPTAQG